MAKFATGFREGRVMICPACIKIFRPEVGYRTQLRDYMDHTRKHAQRALVRRRAAEQAERVFIHDAPNPWGIDWKQMRRDVEAM